jgi:3-dehydroquinate dehydratase / shikimate dehydrogenase
VSKNEVDAFFSKAYHYDFISVTMPHKRAVIEYCDALTEDAQIIGRVNFIAKKKGKLVGCNFDGIGALHAIEKKRKVHGEKVVVYGTGASGVAAIIEAKKRGALVFCMNRTKEKGREVAEKLGVVFLDCIPCDFAVFVNATPIGMLKDDSRLIFPKDIDLSEKVVLDMASRNGSCLLNEFCKQNNGCYIPGKEMFLELTKQALLFLKKAIS